MLPIYVGSLAFGSVLIAASLLLGHGDDAEAGADGHADLDGDADLDADAEVHADLDGDAELDADAHVEADAHGDGVGHAAGAGEALWLPFLSIRFWTFALASFGLTGLLLRLPGLAEPLAGIIATLMGLAVGTGVAYTFRTLQRQSVSGTVGLTHIRGEEAQVMLPVARGKLGKVRLLIDGQYVDLPARTQDERSLNRGEVALVVQVEEGVAQVTPIRRASPTPERP